MSEYKYVQLSEDYYTRKLCMQPMKIIAGDEVTETEKPFLVCDFCNKQVLSTKEEIDKEMETRDAEEVRKDIGVAELTPDEDYITNVICYRCLNKFGRRDNGKV